MSQDILNKFEQLFDDYLDGRLESIDQTELERALKQYPELKSKLKEHVEARANIRIAGEQQLKSLFLKEFETGSTTEENHTSSKDVEQDSSSRKYVVLALIGLASLLGIYLLASTLKNNTQDQPLQIAMIEDPSYELLRGESDTESADNWRQAVQSFMKKDYHQSLELLEDINTDSTFLAKHAGKYSLMKGVSYLKLKQFKRSESEFNKVASSNPYFDQVEWYLSLVAYFDDNHILAKERLDKITKNENHYQRDKAFQLLSQLE